MIFEIGNCVLKSESGGFELHCPVFFFFRSTERMLSFNLIKNRVFVIIFDIPGSELCFSSMSESSINL